MMAGVAGMSGMGNGSGAGIGPGSGGNFGGGARRIGGGVMGGIGNSTDIDSLSSEYQQLAADSLAPNTTTNAFDDYFEYKITEPITIRKNESALVPILQTKIDSERVSLWSPQQPTPLRALWITNTSNLTLDRGSFSIVENGNFGGEGLFDSIHPNERRLLSYAADQAVRVTTDHTNNSHRVEHITISKGVLKQTTLDINEVEYLVHNAAPEARSILPLNTLPALGGASTAIPNPSNPPPPSTASASKPPPTRPSASTSASATPAPPPSVSPTQQKIS